MGGNNELKFGFGVPHGDDRQRQQLQRQPARSGVINADGRGRQVAKVVPQPPGGERRQVLERLPGRRAHQGRFTANLGLRFDHQTAKNLESDGALQRLLPEPASRPDRTPANAGNLQNWTTFSPRVGLSFALDEARKTVLRASYASYYEQLAFGDVGRREPVRPELPGLRVERRQQRQLRAAGRGQPRRRGALQLQRRTPEPLPGGARRTGSTATASPKRDHEFVRRHRP